MSDDLNTPRASAALFKLVSVGEQMIKFPSSSRTEQDYLLKSWMQTLTNMDQVLGVLYEVPKHYLLKKEDSSAKIIEGNGENIITLSGCGCSGSEHDHQDHAANSRYQQAWQLAEKRREMKANKQFQEADRLRDEIASLGYGVKDVKGGTFELYELDI